MKSTGSFGLYVLFSALVMGQEPIAVESVVQLKTVISEDPPSISFYWNEISDNSVVKIFRKNINSKIWKEIHTTLPGDTNYTDKNVSTGLKYEYRVALLNNGIFPIVTYVSAGIRCQETEIRKKIILLVDDMFIDSLEFELSRLEKDLIGDGWEIIRRNISRNMSVKQVKSLIRDIYLVGTEWAYIKTAFLVGHIPVPYSGEYAFDAHDDHEGAWPADVYYGVMNEEIWTDSLVNNKNSKYSENHNVPGDGKFDISTLSNEIVRLAIGRVDFHNLPAFLQSEVELMRNYLNKNHDFRHKIIHPKMQALVDDNLPPLPVIDPLLGDTINYEMMAVSGWRNFTALFNFENVKAGKIFPDALEDSYLWTYGCGWGDIALCKGIGTTSHFIDFEPKTVFTGFYGSWFGDWNTPDNFLRAAIASKGWILTTCWSGRPHYVFHHMGIGETIGSCVLRSQNNSNTYYGGLSEYLRAVNMSLMGDPTLRMHVVSPVKSLQSEISSNAINLRWQASDDTILGYYLYKLDTVTNIYERLNAEVITDTFFTDIFPEQGKNYYMVRARQLTKSASGSYYNLSQGVFDTAQYIKVVSDIFMINEDILIYPNPANNLLTIETGIPDIYNIEITASNGQLLLNKVMVGTETKIDLSGYLSGVYFITVRSKDFVVTRKIVKH